MKKGVKQNASFYLFWNDTRDKNVNKTRPDLQSTGTSPRTSSNFDCSQEYKDPNWEIGILDYGHLSNTQGLGLLSEPLQDFF